MASEINEAGYETLRTLINSGLTTDGSWDYIELIDDTGTIVTRIQISGDARASWTTGSTDQVQQVEVTVSGSDGDISPTVTLSESALKNTDSDTADEMHRDTMTDATIASTDDEVTVRHNIETPQV